MTLSTSAAKADRLESVRNWAKKRIACAEAAIPHLHNVLSEMQLFRGKLYSHSMGLSPNASDSQIDKLANELLVLLKATIDEQNQTLAALDSPAES